MDQIFSMILADEKCNLIIPDGCKRIGTFHGTPIERVQLLDSLKYIGKSIFENKDRIRKKL